MKQKNRDKELPTATDKNPGFTVQGDAYQPLDMLIEQTDSGIETERANIHSDNEDM